MGKNAFKSSSIAIALVSPEVINCGFGTSCHGDEWAALECMTECTMVLWFRFYKHSPMELEESRG